MAEVELPQPAVAEIDLSEHPDGIEWRVRVGGVAVAGGVLHTAVDAAAWHTALAAALRHLAPPDPHTRPDPRPSTPPETRS